VASLTPFARWWRKIRDALQARYYEGPQPPRRLNEIVLVFANEHPTATRLEWITFAIEHARESYRTGWIRGMEYTERSPEEQEAIRNADPDAVADGLDPDWRWQPAVNLQYDPHAVPVAGPGERERVERMLNLVKEKKT
jgi:hypothetical protein